LRFFDCKNISTGDIHSIIEGLQTLGLLEKGMLELSGLPMIEHAELKKEFPPLKNIEIKFQDW